MAGLTVKYNELSAEEFITLWETVWGQGPSLEQTRLAMEHTLFRISVFDGDKIVAMARMHGDMGWITTSKMSSSDRNTKAKALDA